jgi:hypothetical protein
MKKLAGFPAKFYCQNPPEPPESDRNRGGTNKTSEAETKNLISCQEIRQAGLHMVV